jgi:hypothetical protein
MSELKAFDITVAEEGYCEGIVKYRRAVYDKSEADKVIAEKDAEIEKLKAIRKVHIEAIESMGAGLQQDEEEKRHHKYKRCLNSSEYWVTVSYHCIDDKHRQQAERHHKRWLELAEKFKEAK